MTVIETVYCQKSGFIFHAFSQLTLNLLFLISQNSLEKFFEVK